MLDEKEFFALPLTYAEKENALSGFKIVQEKFDQKMGQITCPIFVFFEISTVILEP